MSNRSGVILNKGVCHPQGFRSSGVWCGIKKPGLLDLGLIVSEPPAQIAGVFTQNVARAAPVIWTESAVRSGIGCHAAIVNSGNANCVTGESGLVRARRMAEATAERLNCMPLGVAVASTGLIGAPLPIEKIEAALPDLFSKLSTDDAALSEAMMTTDRYTKRAAIDVETPEGVYRIGGVAKGAGMIAPNMATMLAFIATDAMVEREALDAALRRAVDDSFNAITVDGDTSTNDMAIVMANGASGVAAANHDLFVTSLLEVCQALAKMIVRDGEGATKLAEIRVTGAADKASAKQIAKTIAESPLVKTALHGEDPNWGRILAAAGRAGVPFDLNACRLSIQGILALERGTPVEGAEEPMAEALKASEIAIELSIGPGDGRAVYWTCDLSHEYVTINSAYRT